MYEIKIILIQRLMPFMNKYQAVNFMKILEVALENKAQNSIFIHNVNPIRMGLNLYKLIDDLQRFSNYSNYCSSKMQEIILQKLIKILEIYDEVNDMETILEVPDHEGRNCFWFFLNYDLYKILDCKIIDKYISKKWDGRNDVNCTMLNYSTSYQIYNDQYELFESNELISQILLNMFKLDKSQMNHKYKFDVWKQSMQLRYQLETLFVLFLTIFFQYYVT